MISATALRKITRKRMRDLTWQPRHLNRRQSSVTLSSERCRHSKSLTPKSAPRNCSRSSRKSGKRICGRESKPSLRKVASNSAFRRRTGSFGDEIKLRIKHTNVCLSVSRKRSLPGDVSPMHSEPPYRLINETTPVPLFRAPLWTQRSPTDPIGGASLISSTLKGISRFCHVARQMTHLR